LEGIRRVDKTERLWKLSLKKRIQESNKFAVFRLGCGRFYCPYCGKEFKDIYEFEEHLKNCKKGF